MLLQPHGFSRLSEFPWLSSRVAGLSCVGERFVLRFRISRRKCQFDPGMAMAKGGGGSKNASWGPLWQEMPLGGRFGSLPAYQSGVELAFSHGKGSNEG